LNEEEKREKRRTGRTSDAEEVKEILKAVSEGIPALIKGIMGSIFSEETGGNMGRAAANFYKELKAAGMPDDVAVRMTENYIKTFTDLGSLVKEAMSKKGGFTFKHGKEHGEEISKIVKKRIQEEISKTAEKED